MKYEASFCSIMAAFARQIDEINMKLEKIYAELQETIEMEELAEEEEGDDRK